MTREEAIERLSLCGEVCDDCLTCKAHDEALEVAIAALRKQTGWISVEEQMPADNERVLAFTKLGGYCVARYSKRWDRWMTSGRVTVTHWMPLPAAPEDDG